MFVAKRRVDTVQTANCNDVCAAEVRFFHSCIIPGPKKHCGLHTGRCISLEFQWTDPNVYKLLLPLQFDPLLQRQLDPLLQQRCYR
jgi:hypothetical protein